MADSIVKAIDSVKSQTYENWELIIVNDGSTDGTSDLVKNSIKDNRISYFEVYNGGVSAARNFGAIKAKGKYLLFLDADDLLLPNALNFLSLNSQNNPPIIKGGYHELDPKTNEINLIIPSRYNYTAFIPGSYAIRSDVFKTIGGFDVLLKYSENTELIFRVQKMGFLIDYVFQPLIIYHLSQSGASKNIHHQTISLRLILEKHDDFLTTHVKFLYNQIIGVNCLKMEQYKKARSHLAKAIKFKPSHVSTYVRYIVALFPFLSRLIYQKNK